MIGKTISHYTIVEKLGQGGMGVVYKALDTKLDRFVALKFLPPHLALDEEQKTRFLHEAKAASAIDHPNIASIFEISETEDGLIFIVMGYYEGETLKKKIEKGPLPIDQVVSLANQIAHGLVKAHEHGIIHRDLKPQNVIVTPDGDAKIIDFGLAKLKGRTQLTKAGSSMGTVAYMSPEQARGEEIDPRTDIWSFGVLIYEMLSGTLPFRGEFDQAMIYSVLNEEPPPISSLRSEVPVELEAMMGMALQKDRTRRFQSMGEAVQSLTTLQRILDSGESAGTLSQFVSSVAGSIVRKHRTPVFAALSILVLAAVGLFIYQWRSAHSARPINRTIAVLPFVNAGDSSNEYYAAGFSQDLISAFGKLPQALVISRMGSASYVNSELADSAIAAKLGVRFLLKGTLQLSIARVKISASLFDAENGKEEWSQAYDGNRSDILAMKEAILKRAAQSLSINYDPAQVRLYRPPPDAYEAFLHGLFFRDKMTKDANKMARAYLGDAVGRDSTYVAALVSLSNTDVEHYRQGWDRTEKILDNAERLADRAAALDSSNGQSLAILGNIADLRGDRPKALRLLLKAVERDKNDFYALTSLGLIYLLELNEPRRGLIYLEQSRDLEPTDWLTTQNLAIGYAQIKEYEKAKPAFRRAMQLNPGHDWPPYSLGYTCERMGQIDSAIIYYRIALRLNPKDLRVYDALISALVAEGRYSPAESVAVSGFQFLQSEPEIHYLLGIAYSFEGKQSLAGREMRDGLRLIEQRIVTDPKIGENRALAGLFNARLGNRAAALTMASDAARLDSTDEEVAMKIARTFAILGEKNKTLEWFKRAKSMNPEYDAAYLTTAMDFEKYRKDADLLVIARQE
jgi:eukaryotic-like serine/threonine-protein kinase